ncbi:MAG: DUF4493 domain-containing protein, partial [Muribaculaceae bacterium]|nr:DUF4493 domain-containing protein [Muribaculaceae bacterium]
MKHYALSATFLVASACFLGGCAGDDNPWQSSADGGSLRLSLSADGNIAASTRADDTKATIIPAAADFGVSLSRTDGSFNKKWNRLEEFNREELFPIGEYKIEAFYGDRDTEGFDHPWFYASDNVAVTAGDQKNVSLTATLANSMVSIRYTDEFKSNFTSYSAAIRSTGHDYVVFAQNEDRPAYMTPSQIELNLTLTNASGKKVTLQPAGFRAEARRHYIVRIGVNGASSTGNLTLDVQFEEDVVSETVEVPLGDELFEAPAPSVVAKDFTDGETMSAFESFTPQGNPRYEVYAFGGLKEVVLSLNQSSTYNSPFGNEVQLVGASAIDQANVSASGIEVTGLFRNPDKMGIVALKNFLAKLPIGSHTVTLVAKDVQTRVSEPVTLHVVVSAVDIRIEPVANMEYRGTEGEIYLSTNSPDVRDRVAFKVTVDERDAEILEITDLSSAEGTATLPYKYKYKVKTPELRLESSPLKAYYGSSADPRAETRLIVDFPKYDILVDPFAKKVKLKVVPEDASKLSQITSDIVIISNGRQVDENRVQKNLTTGIINVFDLTESTTYGNVEFALSNASNPRIAIPAFTTENIVDVPNGSFAETHKTLSISNLTVGGGFRVSPVNYNVTSSIDRSEPVGWSSVNAKTCYSGAANINSWFVVPSTFSENGYVVIRSVGYNHNGRTPDRSGGVFNTTYYCTNTPGEAGLDKSIGELFLGSYSYDSNGEHRNDGIDFGSRPLTLTFKYRYTPVNNEVAEAYIKVFNSSGKEISQGILRLEASSDIKERTVILDIYDFGEKANTI